MLVLVMLLTSLHFVDSYLEKRHRDFENFISELIRQPVSIGKIAVGNSGLEPVLEFSDVAIFNDTKTKVLLQAQGLQVGIDLINSLLKWRTQIGLLVVRGIDFFVYQDKDGGIRVSGVKERLNNVAAKSNFAAAYSVCRYFFIYPALLKGSTQLKRLYQHRCHCRSICPVSLGPV